MTVPGTLRRLTRFAHLQAMSCVFPFALLAGLAVTAAVPLPIARYDALLVFAVGLTVAFWALGLESGREVAVIAAFHLIGLGLELFKVRAGSWSYPGDGLTKLGGVPLYAGFMYASVGSYICQAWRRFDLRVTDYRPTAATLLAIGIYANFFSHHWFVDLRWLLAAGLIGVLWRTRVHFTVGQVRHWMPLSMSFALIGLFLWIAENAGTLLGAWRYPNQVDGWQLVHLGKFGAWSLLVSMSFVLVATVKAAEGRLYGDRRQGRPSVVVADAHPRAHPDGANGPRVKQFEA